MTDTGSITIHLPITGLASFIHRCYSPNLISYAETSGISILSVSESNDILIITFRRPTVSYNEENLRTLILHFIRSILSFYSIQCISLAVPRHLFEIVRSKVETLTCR